MSPSNRKNPDVTHANGRFGWDVIAGYYKVRAERAGCHAPGDPAKSFVDTPELKIPPPVFDVDLRLKCPAGPSATRKPAVTGQARVGRTLKCTAGVWKGSPKFRYAWRRGRALLVRAKTASYRLTAADAGSRVACEVTARNRYGVRVVRSGAVRVRT